jgi:protein-S-isoprenylcysteine O-methyltransferase Ste14
MPSNQNRNPLTRALLLLPVPWVFVLSYLLGVGLEKLLLRRALLPPSILLTAIGAIAFALGAALAAWGWGIFQGVKTTRVPGELSTRLVTWGPYRFTRNPMYVGLALAYVGETGLLHQFVPLVILPFTIAYLNRVVIPLEETKLREAFGEDYERYGSRVCRWL